MRMDNKLIADGNFLNYSSLDPTPSFPFLLPTQSPILKTKRLTIPGVVHMSTTLFSPYSAQVYTFSTLPERRSIRLFLFLLPANRLVFSSRLDQVKSFKLLFRTQKFDEPTLLRLTINSFLCNSEDCLALQTGETLELLTSKRLAATPHFVNATASSLGKRALEAIERKKEEDESWRNVESGTVTRETLAVFLQVIPTSFLCSLD